MIIIPESEHEWAYDLAADLDDLAKLAQVCDDREASLFFAFAAYHVRRALPRRPDAAPLEPPARAN